MQYCEIQIELDSERSEALHALLCAQNLSFQELDQTTLNAPPPGRTRVHLYIPADERDQIPGLLKAVRQAVGAAEGAEPAQSPAGAALVVEVRERDEDEWRDAWKRFFSTRRIGRLTIVPSWEAEQHAPAPDEVTLHLDPGRAFGTGGHESTRLCLGLLDQLYGKLPLRSPLFSAAAERLQAAGPAQILDVGCGSGVLAIAALKLWPQASAVAIDTDSEAVEVTLENAQRNQVSERLLCETVPLAKLRSRFTLVLANLTGPTLIELCEQLISHLDVGGLLILSGILESEVEGVASRFLDQGLIETARATEDEWAALQYLRP